MNFLKNMNEIGCTIPRIKDILNSEGIPKNKEEELQIIQKYNTHKISRNYNETIKVSNPSMKDMEIPFLTNKRWQSLYCY
ncbi:hypothetical protein WQ54_31110 [Bacillus sp. SA1-12]|nr:hypothetical protein WQ54_31110 [Bacillus sp. SA1-12]